MPATRRAKAAGRSKKAASTPVFIDLLDSDDDAELTQALQASIADTSSGMAVDVSAKPKIVPQATKDTDFDHSEESEPAAQSASPTSSSTAPNMPIRRSATLPICQILSKSSTPLNSRNNSGISSSIDDGGYDSDERDSVVPKASSNPNFASKGNSGAEHKTSMGFKQRPSKPLSSPSSSQNDTPPTLPSRTNSTSASSLPSKFSTTTSSSNLNPAPLKSSSSLFRARDSIDASFIKSSSVEQLEAMGEEFLAKGKRSHSSGLLSVAESMLAEDPDLDEEEARDLLKPPPPKKRGRPSLSTSGAKHQFIDGLVSKKASSTSSLFGSKSELNGSGSSSLNMSQSSANGGGVETKPSAKKSASKFAPPVERTTSNPDLLLAEILGDDMLKVQAYVPPTVDNMRDYVARESAYQTLSVARRLLDDANRYEKASSAAAPAYAPAPKVAVPQPTSVLLKAGKHQFSLNFYPGQHLHACLAQLTNPDNRLLPVLLTNETYFFKFDGIALDQNSTFADNHIGAGDVLEVWIDKDGEEIPLDAGADDDEAVEAPVIEEDAGNKIKITVKFPDGKTQAKFRISVDKPLSALVEAAAAKLKVNPATLCLKFDGDLLPLNLAVEELDEPLEDDDMVDLVVKK